MLKVPEVCALSAGVQRELIANRALSCVELVATHLEWIDQVNTEVNAICTLVPELALGQARAADRALAGGDEPGPLTGLPIAIKDLANTAGIRTTYGSPLFADHIPDRDAIHVARLKAAGAIVIGKTNIPEWGAGSQSFNTLFETTVTPYDLSRTAGGSSGGAAAALAARMVPIADGSDLGGSLRNPAAFCNVVGFRPSPGRVPALERPNGWDPLPMLGPMARNVADAALLLSVMAGHDPRDPLALRDDPGIFAEIPASSGSEPRIASSADLGFLPVEAAVREVFTAALPDLSKMGCRVEEAEPDLRDAPEVFQVLRAHGFVGKHAEWYESHRDKLKDTIQWNTAKGLGQSAAEIARAQTAHTLIYRRMLAFFDEYEFLVLPATQVLPFSKDLDWIREIEGVLFDNYLQWMEICTAISLTGCPAISMPCGFSEEGLPVGMQIVGPPGRDLEVLRMAQAFEAVTGYAGRMPDICG
jgi:amidase